MLCKQRAAMHYTRQMSRELSCAADAQPTILAAIYQAGLGLHTRLVSLRRRHSALASMSLDLFFHRRWKSAVLSHCASTPALPSSWMALARRTTASFLVLLFRSFRTSSAGHTKTVSQAPASSGKAACFKGKRQIMHQHHQVSDSSQ